MMVRKRSANGEIGPETTARFSLRDVAVALILLLGVGFGAAEWIKHRESNLLEANKQQVAEALETAVRPIVVELQFLGKRMDRMEAHEDAGWSVRGSGK